MAFSYKQRECATCGGTLRYDKDAKEYECLYCGNRYEREESYDGQFSPRNAAVQTLNSLLDVDEDMGNWDMVQSNLNDCQKIDPDYPGVIVARLAASIKRVQLMMGNREAVRTDLAQARAEYGRLGFPFDPAVNDVEADFYERLESSDIRSLLIGVFNVFHDERRVACLAQGFDAGSIHSQQAADDLMNRAFANHDYAQIDDLLQSPAKLDGDALLARILGEYPPNEHKRDAVVAVIVRGVDRQNGRDALSEYVMRSSDPIELKVAIVGACMGRGAIPNGRAIAEMVCSASDESGVITLLGSLKGGVLTDDDIAAVVDALLTHADADTVGKGLNALAAAGYYLTFPQRAVMGMLMRTDLAIEDKADIYRVMMNIGMPEKRRQSVVAAYIESRVPVPQKVQVIDMLAGTVRSLNPMNVEDYLMRSTVDGAGKSQVLDALLAHVTSFTSLGVAAARYPLEGPDGPQVRDEVVGVLRSKGLSV